ncbi:ABC transporter permease [Megalodesulfovibrio paquesii]
MTGQERRLAGLLSLAAAVAVTVALGSVVFALCGQSPLEAWGHMAQGAFGSWNAVAEWLVKATPLMLTGLAVAWAVQMQLWNIGAEGQLVAGGICAAGAALFLLPGAPAWLLAPAAMLAGMLGGALWALGPALLRARVGTSEILTTLLLNYVAILCMEYLYYDPWRDPAGMGFPGTAMLPAAALLPRLGASRLHPGFVLALLLPLAAWVLLFRTRWGYRVRVTGLGPLAAAYAGFAPRGRLVLVLLGSGALAGLAGAGEVCGLHGRLQDGLAVGLGYEGIVAACLARRHPLGVPPAALALAFLAVGGDQLQSGLGLPASIGIVLESMLLLAFLAAESCITPAALQRWRLRHA